MAEVQGEASARDGVALDSSSQLTVMEASECRILEALDPKTVYAFREKFIRAQSQRTWKLVRKSLPASRVVAKAQACSLLERAMAGLEKWLTPRVRRYSKLRWLWMLRRCPAFIFEGVLKTSAPYDWTLAEVLSGGASERP